MKIQRNRTQRNYRDGKLDSVFVKIKDKDKKMVEVTHSCENENPLECYTGPNATFNPYSASELVYEHLRQGEEEPKLFEKFDTTDSTMRVIKYCHDEDFMSERLNRKERRARKKKEPIDPTCPRCGGDASISFGTVEFSMLGFHLKWGRLCKACAEELQRLIMHSVK